MPQMIDILFVRTWWRYSAESTEWFDPVYHWFNIFEGCVWIVFGILVLLRFLRFRNSQLEFWYAVAFFTFAVSDFVEAWVQSSPLIWIKLLNLIALLWLRHRIMSCHYPGDRVY